jgi:hypothetical protein
MLHTYRTMASFHAKIKYFSLDSTFNIYRVRPVRRTSLYIFMLSFNYLRTLSDKAFSKAELYKVLAKKVAKNAHGAKTRN